MPEQLTARLIRWDAERGYGFLQVGSQDVFLHIKDFSERPRTVAIGDLIRFSLGTDRRGRTCARGALRLRHGGPVPVPPSRAGAARFNGESRLGLSHLLLLLGLLIGPVLSLHKLAFHPGVTIVSAIAVSMITYLIYALDKLRAHASHWRIPESTLHLIALAGGWPGAFLAQQRIRHKCSKMRFQIIFWLIVLVHQLAAFDYLLDWKISRAVLEQLKIRSALEAS